MFLKLEFNFKQFNGTKTFLNRLEIEKSSSPIVSKCHLPQFKMLLNVIFPNLKL